MDDSGKIGFDRSRVRILLCDKDPKAGQEVKELLCRCSYQVAVVKSARQVIDVLNLSGSRVDIVLAEVELPNGKSLKMLKHIVKRDCFKHIPIVMMSARDEVAVVVKFLRLGAADFLVKPLRVNELLNLWTHMWRRRRMLELEKHVNKGTLTKQNIVCELFVSDTSESNTVSTGMISEDSNDMKYVFKESAFEIISEAQAEAAPTLKLSLKPSGEDVPTSAEERTLSPPKKNGLRIGQYSAFLSYARIKRKQGVAGESSTFRVPADVRVAGPQVNGVQDEDLPRIHDGENRKEAPQESEQQEEQQQKQDKRQQQTQKRQQEEEEQQQQQQEEDEQQQQQQEEEVQSSIQKQQLAMMQVSSQAPFFGMQPMIVMHPHQVQRYYHPGEAPVGIASGYHPYSYFWPPPPPPPPPSAAAAAAAAAATAAAAAAAAAATQQQQQVLVARFKSGASARREAALNKFRQKRKDRCYEKKIRYASRKRLAEQRPRIKGQFVKRTSEEEEDEEEDEARDLSPESGVENINRAS